MKTGYRGQMTEVRGQMTEQINADKDTLKN